MKLNLASLSSIFENYDATSAAQQAQLDDLKARLANVETLPELVGDLDARILSLDSRVLSLEDRVKKLVGDLDSTILSLESRRQELIENDNSSSCWGWVVKMLRLQAQDAAAVDRPGGS